MTEHDYLDRLLESRPWPSSAGPAPRPRRCGTSRPSADQPGTLEQQLTAIDLYLSTPWRHADPAHAWRQARTLAIPHARRSWRASA
jgi:hypothetical protein